LEQSRSHTAPNLFQSQLLGNGRAGRFFPEAFPTFEANLELQAFSQLGMLSPTWIWEPRTSVMLSWPIYPAIESCADKISGRRFRSGQRLSTMEHIVKISGTHSSGKPFRQTSSVTEAAAHSLQLSRVPAPCKIGDLVTVEYRSAKRVFRITSIGPGVQASLVAEGPGPSLFTASLASPQNGNQGSQVESVSRELKDKSAHERRRHNRRNALHPVNVVSLEDGVVLWGLLNDISKGGCYVSTNAPFATGKTVRVESQSSDRPFLREGRVVASHALIGMGIQFNEEQP